MRTKVLVSTVPFGEVGRRPIEMLEEAGLDWEMNPLGRRPTEAELAELIEGFEVIISGLESITEDVMDRAPGLRFISRATVGLETIDLNAARERGISIAHTPGANSQAVAELTVHHLLSLLRHVAQVDGALRRGEWDQLMGRELSEITVGVLGVGRIGKRVIRHLSSFGPKFMANDIAPDKTFGEKFEVQWAEKEEIFREADVVTLHLPATSSTFGLIGERELSMMKPGTLLINTARGVIVDEGALAAALRSGHLGGAAVDVFHEEPYKGELTQLPNCILTPHVGARTRVSRLQMELEAAENVICFLQGKPVPGLVPEDQYEIQRLIAEKMG